MLRDLKKTKADADAEADQCKRAFTLPILARWYAGWLRGPSELDSMLSGYPYTKAVAWSQKKKKKKKKKPGAVVCLGLTIA